MKRVLLVLLLLSLGSIFTATMSGCGMFVTGREITVTPTIEPPHSDVTPQSTESALPLLDTFDHGPLETAYFALG
jgi:hypothetical protein